MLHASLHLNSTIFCFSSLFTSLPHSSPARVFVVPVISCSPFSPSPRRGTTGHILVCTHLHIKHILWVKERGACVYVCLCESAVALNFNFNQHVGERTILLLQGRTEGPLHNLSLVLPPIPPSPSLSLRRQINHPSIASWKPNFFSFFLPPDSS